MLQWTFLLLTNKLHVVLWLNDNNGAVLALLTLIYVLTTFLIFYANLSSVKEMQKSREEENRPYIVVYLRYLNNGGVEFVVKNIGKTLAKNISITSNPDIDYPKERPLSKSNLLNNTISNMAPDFEYSGLLEKVWDLKDKEGNFPTYAITVFYIDTKEKGYKEEYVLDFNVNVDLKNPVQRDIHDLVQDFSGYRQDNLKSMKELNRRIQDLSHEIKTEKNQEK
ncbi:hypothetical protein [Alkalicoccus saliphilus]|uniref:Uncharacterized protein n=1 Tax=Alkalicoccus saliphilus TaxID=200989 RepID=A0A2T4U408_9BACI|nr:hypothetical protein [Alkalicoccus saliphilus]PTL38126.1 hypothetical protein C6Y45_13100 [Alkalicoccus saliphilus]